MVSAYDRSKRTTEDEEQRLAKRIRKGDVAAVEELAMRNERLAWFVAKRYQNVVDIEDAVQEGILGLFEAAKQYDGRGRFGTYAMWSVRNRVNRYACAMMLPISLSPGGPGRVLLQENKMVRDILARGEELTEEALAKEAGTTVKALRTVRAFKKGGVRLDAAVSGVDEGTLGDVVPDTRPSVEDALLEDDGRRVVREALTKLRPEHRLILEARSRGKTLQKIADGMRLSRERIRQIEVVALERLRFYLCRLEPLSEETHT